MVGSPPEKLHHFGIALGAHVVVQHLLHFFQRKTKSRAGSRKAQRAIHIASAVHLDNAQAGVLLMVRAQPAVARTAVVDFAAEG